MRSPLQAQVVEWLARPGDVVRLGQPLLVVEAMKMEHELRADADGRLADCLVAPGDAVQAGDTLWRITAAAAPAPEREAPVDAVPAAPLTTGREDLRRWRERMAFVADAARPEAIARRHAQGLRTARENVADLCDPGSFIEYGALAVAAQRTRRSEADLIANTPGDGMVTGIGGVNGALFGPERARTAVLAYDATVLAGTQGMRNHQKTDRLLGIAHDQRLPVVLFAEGGGGRPGDTDMPIVAGLHVGTFAAMARLSGRVPTIGIAAGRCFAGNAALLGCCDLIIATRGSNIGMGGPAMVEGAGLGRYGPEDIGPAAVQHANGVIDLLVADEAQAVAAARQCLALFQGSTAAVEPAPESARLREVLPDSRLRSYDSRPVVLGLADRGSVVWLREAFGQAIHTALGRLGGRAVGFVVSNPQHLGGAVDADAADKLARFMQLCDAHGLPLVSLIDTPGFMVGPEVEARAQVRHVSRLFVIAAALRVPFFSVVLRKAFGLGAMGLSGGGFHAPGFTVAWPSAEFGAMGLEGAVRLGYRKELEALPEGPERQALFDELLARQVAQGAAIPMATTLEIDAVIDPADTRDWLLRGLAGARVREARAERYVDPW